MTWSLRLHISISLVLPHYSKINTYVFQIATLILFSNRERIVQNQWNSWEKKPIMTLASPWLLDPKAEQGCPLCINNNTGQARGPDCPLGSGNCLIQLKKQVGFTPSLIFLLGIFARMQAQWKSGTDWPVELQWVLHKKFPYALHY